MINVFVVLLLSLISPIIVSSYFFDEYIYGLNYIAYLSSIAVVYLSFALIGVYLARTELNKSNNFSAILISMLAICMTVTAMFNLVMINTAIYYTLNEIKSGPGFSWSSIYTSIEILIALIVGGNGLTYLAHLDYFDDVRRNPNPNPDLDHWTGKYK